MVRCGLNECFWRISQHTWLATLTSFWCFEGSKLILDSGLLHVVFTLCKGVWFLLISAQYIPQADRFCLTTDLE